MSWVELVGYVASFLVAFSLVMASIIRLRIVNLIGATIFATYGVLIGAIPVVLTNSIIVLINIVHLTRLFTGDVAAFRYRQIDATTDDQAAAFVAEYAQDVRKFYPLFSPRLATLAGKGNGYLYGGFKGHRMYGFALLVDLGILLQSQDLPEVDPAVEREFRDIIGSLEAAELRSAYFMPADYLVQRYRDLGVIGRFHKRLLEEPGLRGCRILTVVNGHDLATVRHFTRNGYAKIRKRAGLVLLELDLGELGQEAQA